MRATMRTRVFVAVAATALLATGCSGGGDDSSAAAGDGPVWDEAAAEYVLEDDVAAGEAPLKIWVEYEEYGDALVAAFEKAHPGVQLEYDVVAKVDAANRMALDGEAGKGPDVFVTNYTDLAKTIDASIAAPIGEYADSVTERTGENFSQVVSREGQMYGVPVSTESIALFYNKTLLEELTGSSEPATTWEEVEELAQAYNDPASNRWTIRFLSGEMYYAYPVLSSLGWELYPDDDLDQDNLDAASLSEGLDYYAGLRDIWDVNTADATYDSIENEFIKGETPYTITGPWVFDDFDKAATAEGFEYGVTTLPAVEGGDPAASLSGLGVGVVSGYSEHPAAARVLVNFLASDEGAAALYQSIGAIPALTADKIGGVEGLDSDEHAAGVLAQSQQADLVAEIPEYMYTAGNTLIANVWDDVLPADEAQSRAVTSYDELRDLAK